MQWFETPLATLRGVGPALTQHFARARITTLWQLLLHCPVRYEDHTHITPLAQAVVGEPALFDGIIEKTWVVFAGKRRLLCRVRSGDAVVTWQFFYFHPGLRSSLVTGKRVRFFGAPREANGQRWLTHPDYTLLDEADAPLETHLTAVYRAIDGVSPTRLRRLMGQALTWFATLPAAKSPIDTYLPTDCPNLQTALELIHHPPKQARDALLARAHPAQKRLIIEELLAQQWQWHQRAQADLSLKTPVLTWQPDKRSLFEKQLSFALTTCQQQAIDAIATELSQHKPMQHLLQGDVGSGKTVVAAMATWQAVQAGYQVVWMAPTSLLVAQHLETLKAWFAPLSVTVMALTSGASAKERRACLQACAAGRLSVLVGTQAVFQKAVAFDALGLMVIDEQHRFGVGQRLALQQKAQAPHRLSLSATPIPRSLMYSQFYGVTISTLREKPAGRIPTQTVMLPNTRREALWQRLRTRLADGEQVYWICPLIDGEAEADKTSVSVVFSACQQALPGVSVAMVHGRMSVAEKQAKLSAFAAGDSQVLVATTVVEVGVDVPGANVMIIESPECLGLAQLHQLRGRIGRGTRESFCVLWVSPSLKDDARARLQQLVDCDDGFALAEADLAARGPGQLFGGQQTGAGQCHIADMTQDLALLPQVQACFQACLMRADPDQVTQWLAHWCAAWQVAPTLVI